MEIQNKNCTSFFAKQREWVQGNFYCFKYRDSLAACFSKFKEFAIFSSENFVLMDVYEINAFQQ
jgi:hypothetical protein